MTQKSRFWNGTVLGDAVVAPYDADREFADVMSSLSAGDLGQFRLRVFNANAVVNALAVTGTSSPISVDTGRAMVDGTWYENDVAVPVTVPTPAASTRFDWIVLEKDWAAQTVRIVRVAGVEGAGAPPALTNTPGTLWQAPLAFYSVTTGGVVAVTDYRYAFLNSFMALSPFARVRLTHSANIAIAGAYAALAWDTEVVDVGGLHSSGANTRITFVEAGTYRIWALLQITCTGSAADSIDIFVTLRKNGVATDLTETEWFNVIPAAGAAAAQQMLVELPMETVVAGDYFEVYALDAGVSVGNVINATLDKKSYFNAIRIL